MNRDHNWATPLAGGRVTDFAVILYSAKDIVVCFAKRMFDQSATGGKEMNMSGQQINRVSTTGLIVLSLTALAPLLLVALPAMLTGRVPPPETDEGTAAHVFQLSIVALVPVGFLFLASADWTQPLRSARRLVFPVAAVLLAFGILFYFEHVYLPGRGLPPPRPGLPLLLLRRMLAVFHT